MKIRINDLARELEVKSKAILDVLLEVGVTEKKTHSSSVEEDEAEKVRKYFSARSGSASREKAAQSDIKPKIDLSKISKPGDVMKLLRQREQEQQHPRSASQQPIAVVKAPPAAPAKPAEKPVAAAPPAAEKPAAPRAPAPASERPVVMPAPRQAPPIVAMPPAPAAPKSAQPPAVVVVPPPAKVSLQPWW